MSAVRSETTEPSVRARLVREIGKVRAESDKVCAGLAATTYQREHDRRLAQEELDKAIEREGLARAAWAGASRAATSAIEHLEAELADTAPRAIDAAIADLELTKNRFRGILLLPDTVRMSDGSRRPTPESKADYEHNRDRWAVLCLSIKELHALKFEVLSETDLVRRLDAIHGKVAAVIKRTTP